ncbi:MAG TPA: hypothetical protein VKQ36_12060 [Ktedonobacterales bacterium]|nr:hypothetical protein [Ktedonobacterales bacterium]
MTEVERRIAVLRLSARLLDAALDTLRWNDVAQTEEDGQAILELSHEGATGMRVLADAMEQDTQATQEMAR